MIVFNVVQTQIQTLYHWKPYIHRIHRLANKISSLTVLIILTAVSSFPAHVLVFERNLPHSPSQELVAYINLQGRNTNGQFSTLAIAAPSPPVTTVADWEQQRLARIPNTVPRALKPSSNNPVVLEGTASFYSREGCLGCNELRIMANGQPLNDSALTIAVGANNKHLVGYRARVTSLATGKTVDVRITDTGGFYNTEYGNRVADLTPATKEAIGMIGGVGSVRVEIY